MDRILQVEEGVEELYRSENLLVRAIPAANTNRWVVTFDNYGAPAGFDRSGFGQDFFFSRGISVITLLGRGNDWYQYPDTLSALSIVRGRLASAERVMTYGSSMGAYAAIRFADLAGADACLALSPQYSNDPRRVPFETRWPQEATGIAWRKEFNGPITCRFEPIVIFDPRGVDNIHARMISKDIPIKAIELSYAGHPVTTYLSAARMLEDIIFAALEGDLDPASTEKAAALQKHLNPVYVSELARRQPPHRSRLGIAIARRALELAPDSELMLHTLAKRLTLAGRHHEAVPLHARAVELSGGFLGYAIPYSEALALAGDRKAALALARQMAKQSPEYAQVHSWLSHLLWEQGLCEEALIHAAEARRLSPDNRHYIAVHANYMAMLSGEIWPRVRYAVRQIFYGGLRFLGRATEPKV